MIITPHLLVGAALGAASANPGTAFGLGLFSHYLIDFLPHWDYLEKLTTKANSLKKVALDFLIGTIFLTGLIWSYPQKTVILAALIGALLPDFSQFVYYNFRISWLAWPARFHRRIHLWQKLSFWQGLPALLVVSGAAVLFLIFYR